MYRCYEPLMSWQQGSFGKKELEKELGLKAGNSTYSQGSSTGVKSNTLLGEGYLSESDTKRLLGNSKLKKAFVDSGGSADSWETINDVDTAIDYLTKAEDEPEETSFIPDIIKETLPASERLQTARDRVKEYEDEKWSGESAKKMFTPAKDPQSFLKNTRSTLSRIRNCQLKVLLDWIDH